jgi:hypothetical protein
VTNQTTRKRTARAPDLSSGTHDRRAATPGAQHRPATSNLVVRSPTTTSRTVSRAHHKGGRRWAARPTELEAVAVGEVFRWRR